LTVEQIVKITYDENILAYLTENNLKLGTQGTATLKIEAINNTYLPDILITEDTTSGLNFPTNLTNISEDGQTGTATINLGSATEGTYTLLIKPNHDRFLLHPVNVVVRGAATTDNY
jgi:hypothetical protein